LLVIAWLFSGSLQTALPFWLPFAILAATEVEFVVRGWRQARGTPISSASDMLERRLPDAADADLGWVETTAADGSTVLVPALPRAHRRSALPLAAVIAVAAVLFAWAYRVDTRDGWLQRTPAERARAQRVFSEAASRIAGRPAVVRCDDSYSFTGVGSDAAGVAFPRRGLAYLQPEICRTLYRIRFERKLGARDDAALAITVLAHEATHLRGIRNEAETECFALQEGVGLGERLGVTPGTARALMQFQMDRDLSDDSVVRLDYRLPAACRNGGALDLHPGDPKFP
jgi:hypothetical protein